MYKQQNHYPHIFVNLSDINECEQNSTCAHICTDKKIGYECQCYTGYKVSPRDHRLCLDVDECTESPCSQKCRNTVGSYVCSCNNRYILRPDKHSCKANSGGYFGHCDLSHLFLHFVFLYIFFCLLQLR